jgi:hypothetical protein
MQVARRCCGFCDGVLWIDKCGWIRGAVQKLGEDEDEEKEVIVVMEKW